MNYFTVLFHSRTDFIKKIIAPVILFFLFHFQVIAQKEHEPLTTGKITGRVIDSLSGQAIEYATISLLKQENDKIVNGTTADSRGEFQLTEVADGTYKILIYFIGYKTGTQNNIIVRKTNTEVNLGDIKLASNKATLKEVTITAEKSIIENKIDKMVFNADKDISSQSGVALDVLKKVPQVSVDVDGNVELQGNSSIRFLINGKPSIIYGSNIVEVLQSIPASQIQSIEIITSPGAKYDAQGTGGIINIILKKSTAEGVNGNMSLSAGTRLQNASINLNAHHKHFGANAFFSGNAQFLSTTINKMDRTSNDTALKQTSQLLQNGTSDFRRSGYQTGIAFDWEISPKDNITASFGYNFFGNNNSGTANRYTTVNDAFGATLSNMHDSINTSNKFREHTMDYDLNYKRKFNKEDQELEISYNAAYGNNYSYYMQTQRHMSPDSIFSSSYGNNPGIENQTNIAIDYTQPFGEDVKLETGAKAVLTDIKSTSDVYLLNSFNDYDYNTAQSSSLTYHSNVYAAYLSGTFKLFDKLDVKTGCRYEYTETKATFSNSGKVNINPYYTIVPSAVISHTIKENQTIKLSYTHRIERPDYGDLNPFINASDPKNLTTGNPNLRPELGDKIELGYNKTFKKNATIYLALFYRGNKDDIQSYTRYFSTYKVGDSTYTNVSVRTRENIGREDNYGLSIFGSVPVTSKINIRSNISCFERYIINGPTVGNNIHGFNYRINMNASYEINNMLSIEVFGIFNSRRINAQGTMPANTTYSFAFRKQLFNKKGSIAITATNPFDKYISQKTELTGENFTLNNTRLLPYRSFGVNFTYKFGKMEFKKAKDEEEINQPTPPAPEN